MSKSLDALDRLEQTARGYCGEYALTFEDINRGIFKEDAEAVETIRCELKAFEIVKDKRVEMHYLLKSKTCEQYNDYARFLGYKEDLTQEEYDLLKEASK